MVTFPNCKINLGLNIVNKRPDGYHNLETVFYPLQLTDALEVIQSNSLSLSLSGLPVRGPDDDNLCMKAYNLLKKDFSTLPNLAIHLHKAVPMGAGLGGGSADGAFMLSILNKKFRLNISTEALLEYALQLGSDCPFFILNSPCFASGRGEVMEPVAVDLSEYNVVLVNPGIHVSTKEAFALLQPQEPGKNIKKIITQPIDTWRDELVNDFEMTVFNIHPAIKEIKDEFYRKGAVYASMTGTGSTVYALFHKSAPLLFDLPSTYTKIIL